MYKPPYAYTGNKFKQLPAIIEHLPADCHTFIDVFGGSGVVALNMAEKFDTVIYNELVPEVRMLFFHCINTPQFAEIVERVNGGYSSDKEGYYRLRIDYNHVSEGVERYAMLYCLVSRSFNNQVRFNRKGEFNLPYGERNYLELDRIHKALEVASQTSIGISGKDFRLLCGQYLGKEGVVMFFDPPYYNSDATYNTGWDLAKEHALYEHLSALDNSGVKWMLTNTLRNRGKTNKIFEQWLDKSSYLDVELCGQYGNSSRFKSEHKTVELLVKNY